jgi:hypothetical protein
MDLGDASGPPGVVTAVGTAEVVESGRGQGNFSSGVEVDNCLERTTILGLGSIDTALAELYKSGHGVLEARNRDDVLRHPSMGGLLVIANALDKLKARLESASNQGNDFSREGGGKHHGLAVLLSRSWEHANDLLDLRPEACVEKTIGFVKDQRRKVGSFHSGVWVGEDVLQSSRSADQKMASLTLNCPQSSTLLCASNSSLYNDTRISGQSLRLHCNLLRELSCR